MAEAVCQPTVQPRVYFFEAGIGDLGGVFLRASSSRALSYPGKLKPSGYLAAAVFICPPRFRSRIKRTIADLFCGKHQISGKKSCYSLFYVVFGIPSVVVQFVLLFSIMCFIFNARRSLCAPFCMNRGLSYLDIVNM